MQTWSECSRQFTFAGTGVDCNTPVRFADYLCGQTREPGTVQQTAGAGRTLSFGGCFFSCRYAVDVFSGQSTDNPRCLTSFGIVTALCVLPLADGSDLAPAYIPNLLVSRSQISAVIATQSDQYEQVLWRHYDRVTHLNEQGFAVGVFPCLSSTPLADSFLGNVAGRAATTELNPFREARIKVKRRMDERHALFVVRNFEWGGLALAAPINIFADMYCRFAVR